MKKVTQEMFDALEVVEGVKQCQTGDYTEIENFGEFCSFGKSCSFGEYCSFGKSCSFENGHEAVYYNQPFYKFSGFSSRQMCETYIFHCVDDIFVRCGCFFGTVDEFKKRVIEKKGEDHGYLKIVDLYVDEIKKR